MASQKKQLAAERLVAAIAADIYANCQNPLGYIEEAEAELDDSEIKSVLVHARDLLRITAPGLARTALAEAGRG